jgi:phage baseplate assembly protein W
VSSEFVGAGWAFPLRTDATGRIALVRQEREIEESIRLILGTSPGERPMRPEFGCGIQEHIFAPADATTAGKIIADVRIALDRWEPRIDLLDVRVHFDRIDAGALYIDLHYAISGSNSPRNLVFPFYLIPEHAELTTGGAA